MADQQHTHTIWFHVGGKRTGWDVAGLDAAHEKLKDVMTRGLQRRTKGGTLLITPWHAIAKVEVKPIRRRK
jgi:hypothetical protein